MSDQEERKRPVVYIFYDGQRCAFRDLNSFLEELKTFEPDDDVAINLHWMTDAEYDSLEEFQGW